MTGAKPSICAGFLAASATLLLSAGAAHASRAHVRIGHTPAGQVLTNTAGDVLMVFPKELNSLELCIKRKPCMTDWPPVTTTKPPIAGPGVDPYLLGTEPYKGKLLAVTYDGWPLHTYRFDFSPKNSVLNIGIRQFGGAWDAVDPAGGFVTVASPNCCQ